MKLSKRDVDLLLSFGLPAETHEYVGPVFLGALRKCPGCACSCHGDAAQCRCGKRPVLAEEERSDGLRRQTMCRMECSCGRAGPWVPRPCGMDYAEARAAARVAWDTDLE